ncbi:MAG: helicase HerA domain-containing protein [Acidobacteriaceae bacterium]
MEIKVTDLFCILGMRGSGKTEITKHFLRQMDLSGYPILILDLNDEYNKREYENATVFRPKGIQDYIENYALQIDKFKQKNDSGMIVFEDIDILIDNSKIPFPIYDLVIRGRHDNLGCMFLFRRANNIHKQILYNSHHIFIPKITLPNDIRYLGDYIPDAEKILPKLKPYEFFNYNFSDGENGIVKMNLKNDNLEVVDEL